CEALHGQHDTLASIQASYPRTVDSRRNACSQPGACEIRRQPVGRSLLDRTWYRRRGAAQAERAICNWIDACENGSQARLIFTHHPQRKLHEVYYARCVGMPSGRVPPLSFGISTSRTGGGRYEPDDIRFQTLYRLPLRSCSNAASDTPSTPAAPRFARTRW